MKQKIISTQSSNFFNAHALVKIGEILLLFISALAIIKIFLPLAGDDLALRKWIIWGTNMFMLSLVWMSIKLRGQKLSDFGIRFTKPTVKESWNTFLLSLLLCVIGLAAYILGGVVFSYLSGTTVSADMSGYDYLKDNVFMLILTLLGVYIVSSFGEEVIYRAFLINRITEIGLGKKHAKTVAVIISTLIFGLIHYEWGVMGMVQTACMGLVMGIFYVRLKKRLWVLVLAHAYMDTILLIGVYIASN